MTSAGPASAQGMTFDFMDTPLSQVMTSLKLAKPGFNYTLAQDLGDALVNVSLEGVSFDAALRIILESVGATYKIDGGVYRVEPKAAPPAPTVAAVTRTPLRGGAPGPVRAPAVASTGAGAVGEDTEPERVVKIMGTKHIDPADVAMLFGGYPLFGEMSLLMSGGGGVRGGSRGGHRGGGYDGGGYGSSRYGGSRYGGGGYDGGGFGARRSSGGGGAGGSRSFGGRPSSGGGSGGGGGFG
jgi:hypothetical protein